MPLEDLHTLTKNWIVWYEEDILEEVKHSELVMPFIARQLPDVRSLNQSLREADTWDDTGRHFFPLFFLPHLYTHPCYGPDYVPKCSPFNLLCNGVCYLATHAPVYELQVETSLIDQPE